MTTIKLSQQAELQGGEYRLHTDDGQQSITVLTTWMSATAYDDDGNEYYIIWDISNQDALDRGALDECCDWDNPAEIYSYAEGKPVTAEIIF